MNNEFINFRILMGCRGHRCVEDFTDIDWRLIDIAVSIIEKYQNPIGYSLFRRELAKAANISLTDAGWYITDVLTFDPIIDGEIVHVLNLRYSQGRYVLSITDTFKKYYNERKTDRKKTSGGDKETGG